MQSDECIASVSVTILCTCTCTCAHHTLVVCLLTVHTDLNSMLYSLRTALHTHKVCWWWAWSEFALCTVSYLLTVCVQWCTCMYSVRVCNVHVHVWNVLSSYSLVRRFLHGLAQSRKRLRLNFHCILSFVWYCIRVLCVIHVQYRYMYVYSPVYSTVDVVF